MGDLAQTSEGAASSKQTAAVPPACRRYSAWEILYRGISRPRPWQKQAPSNTELKIYPNRSHWTCIEPGWEEVADFALDWAAKNARAPNVLPMKVA